MSLYRKMKNVEIEERHPDAPTCGSVAYRMLSYLDENDYPNFELHFARYMYEEDGDVENGPSGSLYLEMWECAEHGVGCKMTLDEMIERYEYEVAQEHLEDDRR